jgi:6-pyruvoyltetrahydropterin/6-carboxytetrahydropterin synthase
MMFILRVTGGFSAAHRLRGHGGKCENLHGHNWRVELELSFTSVDRIGLSMDFREAKDLLAGVLSDYDHKDLNEVPEFASENPSAEHIARNIHRKFRSRFEDRTPRPVRIRVFVWESEGSCCGYEEDV